MWISIMAWVIRPDGLGDFYQTYDIYMNEIPRTIKYTYYII